MDRKYWENKEITVHWWNCGSKTLDYKGTYKGYMKLKGIKVSTLKRNISEGYRFLIPLSPPCKATLETCGDFSRCCDEAIQIFITLLGDKSTLETPRRTYKIHW
jgi:hypothetical protein